MQLNQIQIGLQIQHINYSSLNEEVRDTERGSAYDTAYSVMLEEQVRHYGSELELPGHVHTLDLGPDIPDPVALAAAAAAEMPAVAAS